MDDEFTEHSAPIGSIKTGRLVLTSAVRDVRLIACQNQRDLYQVRFRRWQPVLHLDEGRLTVETIAPQWSEDNPRADSPLHICLNSTVSWEVEFRGSVEQIYADLRGIRLHALDILGSARQIELLLPLPEGASFLYVAGGIREAAIHRPSGVGLRLFVSGGIEECSFDHQVFHALRAETSLASAGFTPAEGYYDLTVTGSAKFVTIA